MDQFEVSTFGVVRLIQAIMPHWREQKFGRLVVIGSSGSMSNMAAYGAYIGSKAATDRKSGPLLDLWLS